MPQRPAHPDDPSDDDAGDSLDELLDDSNHDRDAPLESDVRRLAEVTCIPCQACGKMVNDQAIRCHRCGAWMLSDLFADDSTSATRPTSVPPWVYFTSIVLLGSSLILFLRLL